MRSLYSEEDHQSIQRRKDIKVLLIRLLQQIVDGQHEEEAETFEALQAAYTNEEIHSVIAEMKARNVYH